MPSKFTSCLSTLVKPLSLPPNEKPWNLASSIYIILFLFVKFTVILSKGIPSFVKISNKPVKDANCRSLAKKEEFFILLLSSSRLPLNKFNSLKYKVAFPCPSINEFDIEDLFRKFPKLSNSILILFIAGGILLRGVNFEDGEKIAINFGKN